MARYIDAEPLLEEIKKLNWSDDVMYHIVKVTIEDTPTADVVEVKHGEWIRPTMLADMMHDIPHCSLCGEVPCDEGKYCPNCGAKMDGGVTE